MNSIRNGLGMRKTEIVKEPTRPWNPHFYAIFARVHNTLLEQELGDRLPEGVEVRTVQESADTIYLVLPSTSAVGEGGELSDRDLGEVAGGASVEMTEPTGGNSPCTC